MGAGESTEAAPAADEATAGPAAAESVAKSAPSEPVPAAAIVAEEPIETLSPAGVVSKLNEATMANPDINQQTIEACCKRVRVLCREAEMCRECDLHGAATAVCNAMKALPSDMTVQLQGLAAIVNLCSGEANEHRTRAVEAGALAMIVKAMGDLITNPEVQEMGCIALQNCCYGEDEVCALAPRALARPAHRVVACEPRIPVPATPALRSR